MAADLPNLHERDEREILMPLTGRVRARHYEALSMSDQKKPCSHLDDCWTYGMTALSRRVWERQKMQNNADEREIFYPDRAGKVVDRGIVAAARRPGKNWASVAELVRKMKEDGASAADIETITRALLGDMG